MRQAEWARHERLSEGGTLKGGSNLADGHPFSVTLRVVQPSPGQAERGVHCFDSSAAAEVADKMLAQEVGADKMLLHMTLQSVENHYHSFDHFFGVNTQDE